MRSVHFHQDDILEKGKRVRSVTKEGLEMRGSFMKYREFGGDKNHEYNVIIHLCITQNTQNIHYLNLALQWQVSFLSYFFYFFLEIKTEAG